MKGIHCAMLPLAVDPAEYVSVGFTGAIVTTILGTDQASVREYL